MTHAATLVRLAVLELWTSFRLLGSLAALLGAGGATLLAGELLGPTGPPLGWVFAVALALALAVVAALVAGAVAGDRRRGFAGWLVSRSAPRATVLVAWLGAGTPLVVAGGAVSGVVAWLALLADGAAVPSEAASFAAAVAACLAAGIAALAVALLAGAILRPRAATLATGVAVAGWLLVMVVASAAEGSVPGAGFTTLATFHLAGKPVATGLAATGASLALAAVVLVLALMAFERADL